MKFPKIDLHLHLDGSIRPETAWELANELGCELPATTLEGYRAWIRKVTNTPNVNEYLRLFELPIQITQTEAALTRVTRELIRQLSEQGLAYAEIRFAPQLHTRTGLTQRQAIEAVLEGRRQGLQECPDIRIGILLCMMSIGPETVNWDANMETAELSAEYLGKGVVGADLAGAEGIVPLTNFAPLFRRLSELHVPFTCHAGDSQGPETVRAAMDFGAERIGHGHHIFDDPALSRRAAEEGVTLEICPTSNIQCHTQPSYGEHPAKQLLDMGVGVTINTDNMALAGVGLDDEYRHCLEEMGFTEADLAKMSRCSIRACFLPEEEKASLLAMIED